MLSKIIKENKYVIQRMGLALPNLVGKFLTSDKPAESMFEFGWVDIEEASQYENIDDAIFYGKKYLSREDIQYRVVKLIITTKYQLGK